MKNKVKYILLIIGIVLIVFGALMPVMFKDERDKLAFNQNMGISEYSCKITITSEKDYEVNYAVVYLEDFFGEKELTKQVDNSDIVKTKSGNNFTYTFVIEFESFGEYSEFSKVKKVELNTNIGERVATNSAIKWTTPVMIIVIIAGVVCIIVSVVVFNLAKSCQILAEKTRKELARTNPEINTKDMTDEEVLNKALEIKRENAKEEISGLGQMFGFETEKKQITCEYCGSLNEANSTKCISCGASLKKKR